MNYVLFFLAILMAGVVWWLVKQTINVRPWASDGGEVRDDGVRSPITMAPLPSVKLALAVFLAVATSLFALFISAYSIRMEYADWRPLTEPTMLWWNTGILVLSSVFLQLAWNSAKNRNLGGVKRGILIGAGFAIAFIAAQLYAWNELTAAGQLISSNPSNAFFYLLTGAHAVHLAGGLIALNRSIKRVFASESDPETVELGVELCAVYWHYLLVVWVILFWVLLTT